MGTIRHAKTFYTKPNIVFEDIQVTLMAFPFIAVFIQQFGNTILKAVYIAGNNKVVFRKDIHKTENRHSEYQCNEENKKR